jgi:hypothetical protein
VIEHVRDAARRGLNASMPVLLSRYRASVIARKTRATGARPRNPGAGFPATVLSIYRYENAPILRAFLGEQPLEPRQLRLWALDRPHPDLERCTLGVGQGGKFDLLNQMLESEPVPDDHHVVVADDDVLFMRGDLRRLVGLAQDASLGLTQPAHAIGSHWNHPITRRRLLSVARLTTYVEIGPVFVVGPEWRSRILPFPSGIGLGFTLDMVQWAQLRHEGCRLGVADAVRVLHCHPAGRSYDWEAEMQPLRDHLASVGAETPWELQRDLATWRPWAHRPPWLRTRGGQ